MLELYQTEIIVAGILFSSAILYIFIKSMRHSNNNNTKKIVPIKSILIDDYDKKGGTFHNQEHTKYLDEVQTIIDKDISTKVEIKEHIFNKRDVPPHDKISKERFKEFKGTRLLVAEDNFINQKVIKGLLADSGIEIVIANDGQETLDILENDSDFLMILMDAHMPRVDGFEASRIIRKNSNYDHISIVAFSGDIALDDIRKMKEAGMSEHLVKPLKVSDFYDILYAYSGNTKKALLPNVLDTNKGLEVCSGDKEFYKEILQEFLSLYQDSTDILSEYLNHKQLNAANILLLDIIGVAANIGAQSLKETAINIKTKLVNNNEDYAQMQKLYKAELEKLLVTIKKY